MPMTIKDLNDRKRDAEEAYRLVRKFEEKTCKEIIDAAKKEDAAGEINAILYSAAMDNKQICEALLQYSRLLDEVMRHTEIGWPPVCLMPDPRNGG